MSDPVLVTLKVRENRVRRVLDRMGYRLEKSPRRDPRAAEFGLYRIIALAGPRSSDGFSMTLVEVEAWIEGGQSPAATREAPPEPRKASAGPKVTLHVGDCRDILRRLPKDHFHCCVTSPPYFWVRDSNDDAQIGLEESPDEYVAALVGIFRQVRRVLRADGTAWVVIDDAYCTRRAIRTDGKRSVARDMASGRNSQRRWRDAADEGRAFYSSRMAKHGLKDKDLFLIPSRLALALQRDGWWVRSMIVWTKPNFAPSPATDRPVHGYENVLLLSKSARYFFDASALRERSADMKQRPGRDIWNVRPSTGRGEHTSTFPVELAARCILAGSPRGGSVIDPFGGTGSTGVAAVQHGRDAVLIELDKRHTAATRIRLGDHMTADTPPRRTPARR